MEYTVEEINKILYGSTVGPSERRRRRRERRQQKSFSGRGSSERDKHNLQYMRRLNRRARGCCNRGLTVAGASCLGFNRVRMRGGSRAAAPAWKNRSASGRSTRSCSVRHRPRAGRRYRRRRRHHPRHGLSQTAHECLHEFTAERDIESEPQTETMKAATTSRGPATGSTLSPASAGGTTRAANAAAGDAASLEARVAAFKADPVLMEVATRFVAEVLERAKEEASKRLRERDAAAPQESTQRKRR